MAVIGEYRFNNNFNDSVGSNNGTAIGATFSSSIKAEGTHSSAYDGNDDAVNFGDIFDSIIAGADKQFSITFHFYLNSIATNQVIWGKAGDGSHSEDTRSWFIQAKTGGELRFRWYTAGDGTVYRAVDTPTSTITTAQWYAGAILYDGTIDTNDGLDRVSIYIDKVSKSTSLGLTAGALGAITGTAARLSSGGYIGSSGTTVVSDLDGYVDYTKFYDELITQGQIEADADASRNAAIAGGGMGDDLYPLNHLRESIKV